MDTIHLDCKKQIIRTVEFPIENRSVCAMPNTEFPEYEHYKLQRLLGETLDINAQEMVPNGRFNNSMLFFKYEREFLIEIQQRPAIAWAIEHSLDGLYVTRYEDVSTYRGIFHFTAYLKPEHITYWKLKYGENSDKDNT